jgi:hypothetical protein
MALDYDALLLDPIYDALGVDAVLDLGTAGTVDLVVLDKTEGVLLESPNNGLQLATSKPAACVRVSELTANSPGPGGLEEPADRVQRRQLEDRRHPAEAGADRIGGTVSHPAAGRVRWRSSRSTTTPATTKRRGRR